MTITSFRTNPAFGATAVQLQIRERLLRRHTVHSFHIVVGRSFICWSNIFAVKWRSFCLGPVLCHRSWYKSSNLFLFIKSVLNVLIFSTRFNDVINFRLNDNKDHRFLMNHSLLIHQPYYNNVYQFIYQFFIFFNLFTKFWLIYL